MQPPAVDPQSPIRASDEDRERTVAILREHWQAGRLTLAELEARCEEAWGARMVSGLWHAVRELPVAPVAPRAAAEATGGGGIAGFVLGVTGLCTLLVSFTLLCFVSVPLSATAWMLGRRSRRRGAAGPHRGLGAAGEVLGVVGALLGGLALTWWTAVVLGLPTW